MNAGGPPPNAKRLQNSLNRLCSVCAVKIFVCAANCAEAQTIETILGEFGACGGG